MKKLVSIFAALLITVILIVPASAKTLLLGDVDYDNVVTAKDARSILRAAAMLDSFTDEQKTIADVDQSGKVEAVDARIVLRVAAHLDADLGSIELEDPTDETTTEEPTTEEPTTEEPTTEVPTTEEPTTEEPTTEEPTTEEPTTEEPTTEEPTTEEPTTEEPTTEEPTTNEPAEDDDRVPYENLPAQIKAFLSGKFGFEGSSYINGGKTPIRMYTDGKNLRTSMTMTSDGKEITVDVLVPDKKNLLGKQVVYLINEEKGKYYDATSVIDGGELNINFGNYDPATVYAYVSEKAAGEVTYTVYTIPSGDGKVEIYMLGDEMKCFQICDADGNIQTRMDIDTFVVDVPGSMFSVKDYKKTINMLDVIDMGL